MTLRLRVAKKPVRRVTIHFHDGRIAEQLRSVTYIALKSLSHTLTEALSGIAFVAAQELSGNPVHWEHISLIVDNATND